MRRRPRLLLSSCAPIHPTAHIPTTPHPTERAELTVTPCVRRRCSAAGRAQRGTLPPLAVYRPFHIPGAVADVQHQRDRLPGSIPGGRPDGSCAASAARSHLVRGRRRPKSWVGVDSTASSRQEGAKLNFRSHYNCLRVLLIGLRLSFLVCPVRLGPNHRTSAPLSPCGRFDPLWVVLCV